MEPIDLYSLLKVGRDATEEEIHKAYKSLSTCFHPDKLPRTTSPEKRDRIQQIFLEFKRANDVLTDPVLRLVYDFHGERGVALVRRIQQQSRDRNTRREEAANLSGDESDDDSDSDDEEELNLYDKLEMFLKTNPLKAKAEMQRFFEQYDYNQKLTEENQLQLSCNMEFPPILNLKKLVYQGREYTRYIQKQTYAATQNASAEDRELYNQRIKQERSLVEYQLNRFRDAQKAEVGITLTSQVPAKSQAVTGTRVPPKWSMIMGGTTNFVYPGVSEMLALAGKNPEDQKHPVSMFVNAIYQPVPATQITITTNLTNSQSHQLVLGSARTFSNRSSFRYNMTFLSKSPLDTNLILNMRTFRHIKGYGMASTGLSVGGNGKPLQWNAQWDGHRGKENHQKYSAKVNLGVLQGNSLDLTYRLRPKQSHWLKEYFPIPKALEASTVISAFPKVTGMVMHEFTALANHPELGFGMEHDISLGTWTWIWEWTYQNSTFRVPIPVVRLGTVSDPSFYTQKIYAGIYSLLIQGMVADLFQDLEDQKTNNDADVQNPQTEVQKPNFELKTKQIAEQQVALMASISDSKRIQESQKQWGLVILRATYWLELPPEEGQLAGRVVSMDATRQLQFWVVNGKLSLSSLPKSSWLGFYNLETENTRPSKSKSKLFDWRKLRRWMKRSRSSLETEAKIPQLTIRYRHDGYVYETTIGEDEATVLPSDKSQLLGHAGSVE